MGKILQFPSASSNNNGFSPDARERWNNIPPDVRLLLADNAYCEACKQQSSIKNIGGSVKDGDLILRGNCTKCGNEVSRRID